jgi:hypothetical protein
MAGPKAFTDDRQRCLHLCLRVRRPAAVRPGIPPPRAKTENIADSRSRCAWADKEFAGYIGSCLDITDRKQTEETNRKLAHVARVSTMGQLATALAHELAQPLSAILATRRRVN